MIQLSECTFRKISEGDLPLVLAWRNAPRVRLAMFTSHVISPEEHARWFQRISNDPTMEHFIFSVAGIPAGVFNVTQMNRDAGTCFWAFYASEQAPKGIGLAMEITALDYMTFTLKMRKINCEVLSTNPAVLKLHKRFGFAEEGVFKQHIWRDGGFIDIYRLALFTERWPVRREQIVTLVQEEAGKATA